MDEHGIKLPEHERPSLSSIYKKIDHIPNHLQNIFVNDIQNDCTCSIEVYDSDHSNTVFYVSVDGIKEYKMFDERIRLPMIDSISEKDIWNLLQVACENSKNEWNDILFGHMLYNPQSDKLKLEKAYEKYVGRIHMFGDRSIAGWVAADFVPQDYVYLIPQPEFFGVLSTNIDKFGAFCFTRNIIKELL